MLRRTTLREIRGSLGRYLAMLSIIALGVGFFSGVRETTPTMVHTVNEFWQAQQLYDLRLVSTLGWEDADVDALRTQPDVRYAEGSHSMDILCDGEEREFVLKAHSMPENINLVRLCEGRMPEKENECLLDADMNSTLGIGDTLRISESNDEDTKDALNGTEFTIVGMAESAYYFNHERGTTSIGNGSVAGFVYLPAAAFALDHYSEIFVRFDQDMQIFSDAYKDYTEEKTDVWETLTQEQAETRYTRVLTDAETELADGRAELEEQRADGQKELDDAAKELDDAKAELDDASKTITDGQKELDDSAKKLADSKTKLDDAAAQISDGETELAKAKKEITDGEQQLADAKAELDASEKKLTSSKAELDASEKQLTEGETALKDGQAQLDAAAADLETQAASLAAQEEALSAKEQELAAQLPYMDQLPAAQQAALQAAQAELTEGRTALEAGKAQIAAGRESLAQQQAALDAKKQELAEGRKAFEEGKKAYDAGAAQFAEGKAAYEASLATFTEGKAAYEKSAKELADARTAYETGMQQYEDGKQQYDKGVQELADGKKDYEEGLQTYNDGLADYEDGKAEFEEKIADAEAELADAEAELADLETPDTYVLDRSTNIGYACFESDSQIVEQVARVFPVFFILVAALVCMTTMSRMVEEQRTQIGTLKALGYSEAAIMGKFMFYSGSAALAGCVLGFAVGNVLFPSVIWMSYELMYIQLPLRFVFDWQLALLAAGASLLCSLGTTWAACRMELAETAAGLMRPKAPKAGKRVLLERIPFLWNRLKFLQKVSIRNIFRYKGRFFMMVIGIGGCTALLMTGFGIRDSIAGFADVQYGEIEVADASVTLASDLGEELPASLMAQLDDLTEEYLPLRQSSWDLSTDLRTRSVNLLTPSAADGLDHFLRLHTQAGEALPFPQSGEALISTSIADRWGVAAGDEITLRDSDLRKLHLRVTGVFENHVYDYVITPPETITAQLGAPPVWNTVYVNFPAQADVYQASADLAACEDVTNVSLYAELQARLGKMMSSLDYIVLLVILSAAGLAFIVLYNLTNINITERIREIATIKVLGFFRKETSAYVLRENLALTAAGILLGLGLGILLHRFVMAQIVVDMVSFRIRILPMSFVWSIVLTFVFNMIVNFFMGFKLERINMAESLKSVD